MKNADQPASNPSANTSATDREMNDSRTTHIVDGFSTAKNAWNELKTLHIDLLHRTQIENARDKIDAYFSQHKVVTDQDIVKALQESNAMLVSLLFKTAKKTKTELDKYKLMADALHNCAELDQGHIRRLDHQLAETERIGEIILQQRDENYEAFEKLTYLTTTFAANMPASLIKKLRAFASDKGDFGDLMDVLLPKAIEPSEPVKTNERARQLRDEIGCYDECENISLVVEGQCEAETCDASCATWDLCVKVAELENEAKQLNTDLAEKTEMLAWERKYENLIKHGIAERFDYPTCDSISNDAYGKAGRPPENKLTKGIPCPRGGTCEKIIIACDKCEKTTNTPALNAVDTKVSVSSKVCKHLAYICTKDIEPEAYEDMWPIPIKGPCTGECCQNSDYEPKEVE